VFVVDLFEVVEIEEQCGDARLVTPRAPDLVQEELDAGNVRCAACEIVGL
jgi:hypothetical protein